MEKLDWCSITSKILSVKNIFAKKFMQDLQKIVPKKMFACPLIGKMEMVEVADTIQMLNMLPKGQIVVDFNAVLIKYKTLLNATVLLQQN